MWRDRCLASIAKRWDIPVLLCIVALGGWLRLSDLDLMEFKGDEAEVHRMAVEQASGKLHLAGMMSSVGMHNPPMAVYLFAVPALVSGNPIFMAGFAGLLNTLALMPVYMLGRKWASRGPALAATLLLAASPWAVVESRKIWAQDLLLPFSTVFLLLAVSWLRQGKMRHAVGAGAAFGVVTQLHYSALALVPVVMVAVFLRRRSVSLRQILAACAVFLAMWLPFSVYLIGGGRREFVNQGVGRMSDEPAARRFLKGSLFPIALMGHAGFETLLGRSTGEFLAETPRPGWLTPVLGVALIGGVIVSVWKAVKGGDEWLILLTVLAPSLLLPLHGAFHHYFIISWPATFILMALLADALWRWVARLAKGQPARAALAACLVAGALYAAVSEVQFLRGFYSFLASRGATLGEYGSTYREKLAVAKYLVAKTPQSDFVLMDYSSPKRTECTFGYLYAMLGGAGNMLQEPPEGQVHTTPVFAVLGPDVKGSLRTTKPDLKDGGVVPVGALRVQEFLPLGALAGGTVR